MLNWPLEYRAALVFLMGLFVGGQINRAIYRLAWSPRHIGPWSQAHLEAPPRHWSDRLPVWGWFGMERESKLHGDWFWLRPMLIELLFALGLVALYVWECDGGMAPLVYLSLATVHCQFFAHAVLVALMTTATFIDLDEKTIPDSITVPGTLFALGIAALLPNSLLPVADGSALLLSSPNEWPPVLDGPWGLAAGWAVVAAWCYALFPKTIWTRQGIFKACQFLVASMLRHRLTWAISGLGVIVAVFVFAIWTVGGEHWQALLTGLVGLAFGGALIWGIRVAAGVALGVEAMGFGDVTLLAMIGAFFGWQPVLIVFLLSPFAGAVIALLQWLISGEREIAYGPFLCAAALLVLVRWPDMWERWGYAFVFGKWIPIACFAGLVPMAMMLFVWRALTGRRTVAEDS